MPYVHANVISVAMLTSQNKCCYFLLGGSSFPKIAWIGTKRPGKSFSDAFVIDISIVGEGCFLAPTVIVTSNCACVSSWL